MGVAAPKDDIANLGDVLHLADATIKGLNRSRLCVHLRLPAVMLALAQCARAAGISIDEVRAGLGAAFTVAELEHGIAALPGSQQEEIMASLAAWGRGMLPPGHG